MTHALEFRLDRPAAGPLVRALRTRDASVTLLVPQDGSHSLKLPTAIARGVRLDLRWLDAQGHRRPGLVRLTALRVAADGPQPCLRTAPGGGKPMLELQGGLSCQAVGIHDVAVTVAKGSLRVTRLTLNEQASVEQLLLADVLVGRCTGPFAGHVAADDVTIEMAHDAHLSRARDDPHLVVAGTVWDCTFHDLRVTAVEGSRLERCHGRIRLEGCRDATIQGGHRPHLTIEAAFDVRAALEGDTFADGELKDVAIEPGSIEAIARIAKQLRVLDLAPETVRSAIAGVDQDRRLRAAELLHEQMSEKAARQHAVDLAAVSVLDLRRRSTRRLRTEWWLLTSYALLGYGRTIRRPLLVWALIVALALGFRFARAVDDEAGFVTSAHHVHVTLAGGGAEVGGDVVMTTVLLPLTWNKSALTVEDRLRVPGGYLTALRLAMIVPLLSLATAVRRRVRIKPRSETS